MENIKILYNVFDCFMQFLPIALEHIEANRKKKKNIKMGSSRILNHGFLEWNIQNWRHGMRMLPKQDQAIVCSWRRKLHRVQNHDRKGNKRPITDARFFSLFSETQQKDVIDDIYDEAAEIIKDLSIPLAWLHEAMALWSNYYGVVSRALEHYVVCTNWQRLTLFS